MYVCIYLFIFTLYYIFQQKKQQTISSSVCIFCVSVMTSSITYTYMSKFNYTLYFP